MKETKKPNRNRRNQVNRNTLLHLAALLAVNPSTDSLNGKHLLGYLVSKRKIRTHDDHIAVIGKRCPNV